MVDPSDLELVHTMHRLAPRADNRSANERIDFFMAARSWLHEPRTTEPDKCDEMSWHRPEDLPDNTVAYIRFGLSYYRDGQVYSEFGGATVGALGRLGESPRINATRSTRLSNSRANEFPDAPVLSAAPHPEHVGNLLHHQLPPVVHPPRRGGLVRGHHRRPPPNPPRARAAAVPARKRLARDA